MNENFFKSIYNFPYPALQQYAELQPPTVMLDGPYIGEQLDEEWKRWTPKRAVILNGPTGCGKTQFVLSICRRLRNTRNAIQPQRILIVANRRPLLCTYRNEVAVITGEDELHTKKGIAQKEDFDNNIYVVSYQSLPRFLNENQGINFRFVFFDEIQFLLQDSTFSGSPWEIYGLIFKRFKNSVRVYMSATIDKVLPYILQAELNPNEYLTQGGFLYHKPILAKYGLSTLLPIYACWDSQKQMFTDKASEMYTPMPTTYKIEPDYAKVGFKFFIDDENLIKMLKKSGDKSIIFVNSKKKGRALKECLGSNVAMYLDAEVVNEDAETVSDLIVKEKFDEKYLIATSVFCNGNNIKDPQVKNVVIFPTDPEDIVQMCGRRRISGAKDGFTLYLHIPKLNEVENEIQNLRTFQDNIRTYDKNSVKLMYAILNNYEIPSKDYSINEQIRKVTYITDYGEYRINPLTNDALFIRISYLNMIKEILEEEGIEGYCRFICSNLFRKEFASDMIFDYSYVDEEAEYCAFLDPYCGHMSREEFDKFSMAATEKRIELFGKSQKDNSGKNRKELGVKALNHRFEELGIPYVVEKATDGYILKK